MTPVWKVFDQHYPNLHNLYICSVFSLYTGQVPRVIFAKELFQVLFDQSSHDSNTKSLITKQQEPSANLLGNVLST